MVYNRNGMYDDAIRVSENSLQTDPTNQHMLWSRGNAYARSGRRREAEDSIAKLKAIAKTQYVIRSFIASIYGALDQKEEAFDELKQALDEREPWLKWINADPTMDPLREDPRFKGVLRRLNLAK